MSLSSSPKELVFNVQKVDFPARDLSPQKELTFHDIVNKKAKSNLNRYQNVTLKEGENQSFIKRSIDMRLPYITEDEKVIFG